MDWEDDERPRPGRRAGPPGERRTDSPDGRVPGRGAAVMSLIDSRRAVAGLLEGARAGTAISFARHLQIHGPLLLPGDAGFEPRRILGDLAASGLTGRGGAAFPSARKIAALQGAAAHVTLVVNAMEGEPASIKDQVLCTSTPHLVLDGATVAAGLTGADRIVVAVAGDRPGQAQALLGALAQRPARVPWEVLALPGRYVSGEESALARAVGGHEALPRFRPDKSLPLRSARRRRVLVHNAETLAHLALVARHGAEWFRSHGTTDAPGTTLVTVSGAVARPGVFEVDYGIRLIELLTRAGAEPRVQAALLGGYGGAWLAGRDFGVACTPVDLRRVGATLGPGIVVALAEDACGLAETARIARFMAGESAGQCGPCVFGLPAIAADLDQLAAGRGGHGALQRLQGHLDIVEGRGACRHPDGVVRLVRSALEVFAEHLALHAAGRPCPHGTRPSLFGPPPLAIRR